MDSSPTKDRDTRKAPRQRFGAFFAWGALMGIVYYVSYTLATRIATPLVARPTTWSPFWNAWAIVDAGLGAVICASVLRLYKHTSGHNRHLPWACLVAAIACAVVLAAVELVIWFTAEPLWDRNQVLAVMEVFARYMALTLPPMLIIGFLSGLLWKAIVRERGY
jgi:hypothetical protein